MPPGNGRPSRRYARSKAEAARLGIPTYYSAKRSKAAAERRGLPQAVLRGHARRDKGEVSLRELTRALGSLVVPKAPVFHAPALPGAGPGSTATAGPKQIISGGAIVVVRATRDEASLIGHYWRAIGDALASDDEEERQALLAPFRGAVIDGHELDVDLDSLEAMARAGLLDDVAVSL